MSGINRFLSRRDRSKGAHKQPPPSPNNLQGLFANDSEKDKQKPTAQGHDKKVREVKIRLNNSGISTFHDEDISYVLLSSYVKGDTEKAFELLSLLAESDEGVIKPYNPSVKLLGAVNRNGVSCYLDATLFAMFARLDSFEAMLYNTLGDENRKRLSTLLRLWVNTLRVGKLITTDVTKQIQETLAKCGWDDAAKVRQQDASEAFAFITEKLELPMLTLKMDIFHTGKEDLKDDHKFVKERLLEVAVPEDLADGTTITLEDCLETYFNNRIEVKRYLERKGTTNSFSPRQHSFDSSKGLALHVESVECSNSEPSTPSTLAAGNVLPPYSPIHSVARNRTTSIIQDSYVPIDDEKSDILFQTESSSSGPGLRRRAMSMRKEVLMPAWQFFSLIPWYTDTAPSSDAEIAAHFSSVRPVLGICLKRYSFLADGEAVRRNTHIDVPTEIGLPHFIHDDSADHDTAAFGNFKLSLQSVVCHRGNSVHAGHYVSIVRGQSSEGEESWLLFDDLNMESRIKVVDIDLALSEESPYLLFYQVQPIEGDPGNIDGGERPPSYNSDSKDSEFAAFSSTSQDIQDSFDDAIGTGRLSAEDFIGDRRERGRSIEPKDRRRSILFGDENVHAMNKADHSVTGSGGLHVGDNSIRNSRSGSKLRKGSRSTQLSQSTDRRLSVSFTRFAEKLAVLGKTETANNDTMADVAVAAIADKEKIKRENGGKVREKNRPSRLNGIQNLTKEKKDGKPDRECVVM